MQQSLENKLIVRLDISDQITAEQQLSLADALIRHLRQELELGDAIIVIDRMGEGTWYIHLAIIVGAAGAIIGAAGTIADRIPKLIDDIRGAQGPFGTEAVAVLDRNNGQTIQVVSGDFDVIITRTQIRVLNPVTGAADLSNASATKTHTLHANNDTTKPPELGSPMLQENTPTSEGMRQRTTEFAGQFVTMRGEFRLSENQRPQFTSDGRVYEVDLGQYHPQASARFEIVGYFSDSGKQHLVVTTLQRITLDGEKIGDEIRLSAEAPRLSVIGWQYDDDAKVTWLVVGNKRVRASSTVRWPLGRELLVDGFIRTRNPPVFEIEKAIPLVDEEGILQVSTEVLNDRPGLADLGIDTSDWPTVP